VNEPRDLEKLVRVYREAGWHTLVLPAGEKAPTTKGWQKNPSAEPGDFKLNSNVGVLLGKPSGGLVDVDLDTEQAAKVGRTTLADMPSFGRRSRPRSHRLVYCADADKRVTYEFRKQMVLELRTNGGQTMFPPSIHPAQELVQWEPGETTIPTLDWETLQTRAGITAFLAVVAALYPEPKDHGTRDEICLALTGALAGAGLDAKQIDAYVVLVADIGKDEEAAKRAGKAEATLRKMDAKEPCWGLPKLCELLGITDGEVQELREWLGGTGKRGGAPGIPVDPKLPQIWSGATLLDEELDAAQAGLVGAGVDVFQRGESLVRVAHIQSHETKEMGGAIRRAVGSTVIRRVKNGWMVEKLSRVINWMKMGKHGAVRESSAPGHIAMYILERVGHWGEIRVLRGVVHTPMMRRDGSILQTNGYDADTSYILDTLGVEFPLVGEAPTKEQAEAAIAKIEQLFSLYPFTTNDERAVPTAAVLTVVSRATVAAVPMFVIDAADAAYGKTKIVEAVSMIALGHIAATMTQGRTEEETEKRISSMLMTGDSIIVMDNASLPITGDFLCQMVTGPLIGARILGRSEVMKLPNNVTSFATGINVVVAHDMSRRVVRAYIDGGVANPETRSFPFDPVQVARERRVELVVAALTVLRAYVHAGRPCDKELPVFASFEDWNLVRGALKWLGRGDPYYTHVEVRKRDPRRNELLEILRAWSKCFGCGPMTLAQVKLYCEESPSVPDQNRAILYEALCALTPRGDFNARSIGGNLRKHLNRVVGSPGVVLRYQVNRDGIAEWWVDEKEVQPGLGLDYAPEGAT